MCHEIRLFHLQCIHHARDIDSLILLRVADIGMRRQPHTTKIRYHDGVIFDQYRGERRPHVSSIPKTVQQNHCRPLPADPYKETGSVGLDHLRMKDLWKCLDRRKRGRREKSGRYRRKNLKHVTS